MPPWAGWRRRWSAPAPDAIMSRLRTFTKSPLARHPALLARKVAWRLGLYREDAPLSAIPSGSVAYPAHWAPTLRSWLQQVPLNPPPHSFNRVFGRDFDESLLLGLCREGPRRGEKGLTGDIKLIWDYSRGQPLFTNAAAGPAQTGACAQFIRRWQEANADTNGPAWVCAMDTAIRAANWIFSDTLLDGALAGATGHNEFSKALHRHGQSIWRRLEIRIINSNHYLADLLGLAIIGSIFPQDPPAQRWLAFARDEFPLALLAQTREDGGLNEASLRYHAFVTEMALLFRLALGTALPPTAEARLKQMCQVVADFEDATGDVFPFGDDDSGRVLAVDFASTLGRAQILLRLAAVVFGAPFKRATESARLKSGWWIRRAGDFTLALEFGGVGLEGLGGHAHNDDLSITLEWRNRPVIVDPGSFLYTSDPEARNQFRSTKSHNTLIMDGNEQRGLTSSMFFLPGPDAAFQAEQVGQDSRTFHRPLAMQSVHRRNVSVRADAVSLYDHVDGSGQRQLEWRFHLHPDVRVQSVGNKFVLTVPDTGTLLLEAEDKSLTFTVAESEYSPAYGRKELTRACIARGSCDLPASVEWRIRPLENDSSGS